MEFTYKAYQDPLEPLRARGYAVCGYHDYEKYLRCVILRHDIDNSLPQAVHLTKIEADAGVKSIYFDLLRTDFYNVASKSGQDMFRTEMKLTGKRF